MSYTVLTLAERPDLEAQLPRLHSESWPAFLQEDATIRRYWGKLFVMFPEYQFVLCDQQESVIAAGHALPLAWDGTTEHLPEGWDEALERGFYDAEHGVLPVALCGLSIVIAAGYQGQGLSERMLDAMKNLALTDGLMHIIIPVRPSMKHRYPHMSIQEYARWKREDGFFFDPWLRIHQRLGAHVLGLAPRSMAVTGTIQQWTEWTGMNFSQSGSYPVSGGLEPVIIDCERDYGYYEESNIWVHYALHTAEQTERTCHVTR